MMYTEDLPHGIYLCMNVCSINRIVTNKRDRIVTNKFNRVVTNKRSFGS